jgi:hypothetical protein
MPMDPDFYIVPPEAQKGDKIYLSFSICLCHRLPSHELALPLERNTVARLLPVAQHLYIPKGKHKKADLVAFLNAHITLISMEDAAKRYPVLGRGTYQEVVSAAPDILRDAPELAIHVELAKMEAACM